MGSFEASQVLRLEREKDFKLATEAIKNIIKTYGVKLVPVLTIIDGITKHEVRLVEDEEWTPTPELSEEKKSDSD
jgi:hypothetical protein